MLEYGETAMPREGYTESPNPANHAEVEANEHWITDEQADTYGKLLPGTAGMWAGRARSAAPVVQAGPIRIVRKHYKGYWFTYKSEFRV